MLSKPGMFETPETVAASLALDDYIQPTLNHGMRVWWAYFWPTLLIATFITGAGTVSLRIAWQDVKISGDAVRWGDQILSYLPAYLVSVFTIRYVLGRRFRSFRIALLPCLATPGGEPLPRNFARTMRVWWAYTWRALIGTLIGYILVILPLSWFLNIFNPSPVLAATLGLLIGVCVGAMVSIYVIYSAILGEEFGDFRVALLPRKSEATVSGTAAPTAPTPAAQ